jgi:hypothetical protein
LEAKNQKGQKRQNRFAFLLFLPFLLSMVSAKRPSSVIAECNSSLLLAKH